MNTTFAFITPAQDFQLNSGLQLSVATIVFIQEWYIRSSVIVSLIKVIEPIKKKINYALKYNILWFC